MGKRISFDELVQKLDGLKNINIKPELSTRRRLQRKRSNVFGGGGWKSGGIR